MKDDLAGVVVCVQALAILVLVSAADEVNLVGQTETIVFVAGDDVILPCTLRRTGGVNNALEQAVEWQRPDLDRREVHFYRNLRDQNADQNPSYRGRTSLFRDELETGNISLKLTRVKLDDSGNYTCSVISLDRDKKVVIKLSVGAVSQPVISIVGPKDYGVVLKCEAEAWTFKPEMTWLDSDGNILPADGPTEMETDSEGRYTMRGHVTIQKTDNNMFTCKVLQQKINHKMETQINVPGGVFPWSRWQKAGLIIGVLALLAVAVLVVLYMWRKQKIKEAELGIKEAELEETKEELGRASADLVEAEAELKDKTVLDIFNELAEMKKEMADKDLIIAEMKKEMDELRDKLRRAEEQIKNLSRFSDQQGKTSQNNSGGNQAGLMEMKPLLGPGSKVEDV